jgi:hypothetical protein
MVKEMDRKWPEVDDLGKVLAETLEAGTLEKVMSSIVHKGLPMDTPVAFSL